MLPPSRSSSSALVWQGWRMDLPHRWNPIKLDGDYDMGNILLADMHRLRLGVRWRKIGKKKFDPDAWAKQALRDEVGQLAADEAKPIDAGDAFRGSLIYYDPEPPGRDVWVAYSPASKRVIELVYRARGREHVLADSILPTLVDSPPDEASPWSIFGLSCLVPRGMTLAEKVLNAGDLSLHFTGNKHELTVRQISLAEQAMKRMPLDKWINQQEWTKRKHYRRTGQQDEFRMEVAGRELEGYQRRMRRRRRFFWKWTVQKVLYTYGLHDAGRDRLVFVQATDDDLAQTVLKTVGWAWTGA